jgi:cell division septation protein DedD
MRDESKHPCQAGGKAQTKPASQKRNSTQKPKTPPQQREEEAEADSTERVTPTPRYSPSTTKTPEGLGMARLVGFTEQQWNELVPLLHQQGFRPY